MAWGWIVHQGLENRKANGEYWGFPEMSAGSSSGLQGWRNKGESVGCSQRWKTHLWGEHTNCAELRVSKKGQWDWFWVRNMETRVTCSVDINCQCEGWGDAIRRKHISSLFLLFPPSTPYWQSLILTQLAKKRGFCWVPEPVSQNKV